MTALQRALMTFLSLSCVSGCGAGGPDGAGGAGGAISVEDFGAAWQNAACDRNVRCGLYLDHATCMKAAAPDFAQLRSGVKAGRSRYDGAAATDCVNALASLSCNISETLDGPAACNDVFKGTRAAGATCFANAECPSLRCRPIHECTQAFMCCEGTCQPAFVDVPEGGDCMSPDAACARGTFCRKVGDASLGTLSATCVAYATEGQACTGSNCLPPLGCAMLTRAGGVCARLPADGEPCSDIPCDPIGDICDQTTKRCGPPIPVGEACPTGFGCVVYATCDAATEKCAPRGSVGDPCASLVDCLSLICTNGTCAARPSVTCR